MAIEPYGGTLKELIVPPERAAVLRAEAVPLPSWQLTPRQLCDLELLMTGALSPLGGFLGREDYEGVLESMRLTDGTLWPIPITLDLSEGAAEGLELHSAVALRDPEGAVLAILRITDIWRPDLAAEAEGVFGTTDPAHPGVAYLKESVNPVYVGGRVEGIRPPAHFDFPSLRLTPRHLAAQFEMDKWDRVIAFQTRNPMHRAHVELTMRAVSEVGAGLLIHPVVGLTRPGDIDHFTRVRACLAVLPRYPDGTARLALLPLAMRMAGPREVLLHAIIRRNHGCTHLIVGRDHAGPGAGPGGAPFYGPYDAQRSLAGHEDEIGVAMVPFRQMVYVDGLDSYLPDDEVPHGMKTRSVSGTELRRRLKDGEDLPAWFTYPEVVHELRRAHRTGLDRGFAVFFTGLPSAGKSTTAQALMAMLMEVQDRSVTLLDGDLVRRHLSSELGFSKEHRDLNVTRIGFVAAEIAGAGGIALCAPIAPYDSVRKKVRGMVEERGVFLLIHVATPLDECERRDPKGLYAKARAGLIQEFTGVSDPYEPPADAELTIDTALLHPEQAAEAVLEELRARGLVAGRDSVRPR